jgi:hypothetical protein
MAGSGVGRKTDLLRNRFAGEPKGLSVCGIRAEHQVPCKARQLILQLRGKAMTHTVEAEQLKIWSDETDSRTKAAIAEFEEWCSILDACGLSTPTLDPNDKRAVAFASAFHDVIADFEELEGPALRRERNHSLSERFIALRLLQGAINECSHRSVQAPRETLKLAGALNQQISFSEQHPNADG